MHGIQKAVLQQRKLRKTVVAAVKTTKRRGEPLCIDAWNLADISVDINGLEIAALQAAPVRHEA
jgi:hypothetical protein